MKPDECREGIPCQSMCETRCGTRHKWVGLTEEEIFALRDAHAVHLSWGVRDFACAVEAALKEKNA